MSSRQPGGRTSRPSPPHQHFTTPSTYSQGLTSLISPTTLRQPSSSARTSTSMSSPLSVVGRGATQATPSSSYPMAIRNEHDFSLALSIQAAQGDRRECPWYGVWSKVLERYIFRDADGSRTACTCVPQYSLVASHDSSRLPQSGNSGWSDIAMGSPSPDRHLMTPGSPLPGPPSVPYNHTPLSPRSQAIFGGPLPPLTPSPLLPAFSYCVPQPESPITQHVTRLQALHARDDSNFPVSARPLPQSSSLPYPYPSDGIPPVTPPRPTTRSSDASSRIPDFVQILEHAQQPFPAVPGHVIRRVIMIVEIKPELPAGSKFHWEYIWDNQVQEQVLHAFEADRTLKYLGVIIAAGRHWVYGTVRRGSLVPRTMSETRDPTFPGTRLPVPSSDGSTVEEWPGIQPFFLRLQRPDFLPKQKQGEPKTMHIFKLLDAEGESLRAFQEILKDMRRNNSDIWD
ncbi:uncharacterized protein HD556DRAFT_603934 [Suillus plorans]|uniref:Uncharacterized protein n=1 Tax=Suillus plorans TaxID=116603 RepID=A0A9P7DUV5_9AGAM|nr:uncharacterized protein HD556DRAFT_603934 [Suillus plorans]KAG1803731.1 hypothetical protein HD556DRAFT_603934 [Suillus plorans]